MRSTELERRSRQASIACIAGIATAAGAPQAAACTLQQARSAPAPQMPKEEGQNGGAVHLQAASCDTVRSIPAAICLQRNSRLL